jgi:hypothetical protein
MVAYKLLRVEVISETLSRRLADHFRQQWFEQPNQRGRTRRQQSRRPSYYVVRRHRLGEALLDLVRGSAWRGLLTPTKAGMVLGVKPRNVDPLLHGTAMEGGR